MQFCGDKLRACEHMLPSTWFVFSRPLWMNKPVLWVSPMKDVNNRSETDENTLSRGANIVSAYVRRNTVSAPQIGPIIRAVYEVLATINRTESTGAGSAFQPAVPVRKSITPEYLICLEDGRHLKMLKRYLRSHYKMTPDQYRVKWVCLPTIPWWRPTTPASVPISPKKLVWAGTPPVMGLVKARHIFPAAKSGRPERCGFPAAAHRTPSTQ